MISKMLRPFTPLEYTLTKCFSLLLLGLFLSGLATVNYSLSTIVGLACAPLIFACWRPARPIVNTLLLPILILFSPMTVAHTVALTLTYLGGADWAGLSGDSFSGYMSALNMVLEKSAFAWNVWGTWGIGIALWSIWWPAWIISVFLVTSP